MFSESLVDVCVRPRGSSRTPCRKRRHVRHLGPNKRKDDAATTRGRTGSNGAERRQTAASRRARNAVHGGIFGTTAADPSRFIVFWASQGEFASYLRHSGHPKTNSLAVCSLPKPLFPKVPDRSRSAVLPQRRGWRSHMDIDSLMGSGHTGHHGFRPWGTIMSIRL